MKILVLMDSFKGSLTSEQAGQAVREGILLADETAKVSVYPFADGGEGTLEAFLMADKNSKKVKVNVSFINDHIILILIVVIQKMQLTNVAYFIYKSSLTIKFSKFESFDVIDVFIFFLIFFFLSDFVSSFFSSSELSWGDESESEDEIESDLLIF